MPSDTCDKPVVTQVVWSTIQFSIHTVYSDACEKLIINLDSIQSNHIFTIFSSGKYL